MPRRAQQNLRLGPARISKRKAAAAPPRNILKLDSVKRTITAIPAKRHILKINFVKRTIEGRTEIVGQATPAAAAPCEKFDIGAFFDAERQERARCDCAWQQLCEDRGGASWRCGTDCCQTPVRSIEGTGGQVPLSTREEFEEEESEQARKNENLSILCRTTVWDD